MTRSLLSCVPLSLPAGVGPGSRASRDRRSATAVCPLPPAPGLKGAFLGARWALWPPFTPAGSRLAPETRTLGGVRGSRAAGAALQRGAIVCTVPGSEWRWEPLGARGLRRAGRVVCAAPSLSTQLASAQDTQPLAPHLSRALSGVAPGRPESRGAAGELPGGEGSVSQLHPVSPGRNPGPVRVC